ncbi:MAG: hypothetical protein IH867_12520 [Chloroflexi bacterium]|nr:hypothetical protein [Chloroflexota bacterium]
MTESAADRGAGSGVPYRLTDRSPDCGLTSKAGSRHSYFGIVLLTEGVGQTGW